MLRAMLVAIIALTLIFGIPLSAILGNVWLRAKRMDLEAGGSTSGSARRIAQLEAQNEDLQRRVEVLETIVTSGDEPAARARVRVAARAAARGEDDGGDDVAVPAAGAASARRSRAE